MTLGVLEGHSMIVIFSNMMFRSCKISTYKYFAESASAELLVSHVSTLLGI